MDRPLDIFVSELGAALERPGIDPSRSAAELLRPWLQRPDLLGGSDCAPLPDRYARRIVHADPLGRFSVLALVWSPGQASPVHAHHAWCALGVHLGALSERIFAPRELEPPALTATLMRPAGACSHTAPRPDYIHQIANTGDRAAVSVHVYGVAPAAVDCGINRVYA